MNLDKKIVKYLQEQGGSVTRPELFEAFDTYSKGYLDRRIYALEQSDYIEWLWVSDKIYLTEKGRRVKT